MACTAASWLPLPSLPPPSPSSCPPLSFPPPTLPTVCSATLPLSATTDLASLLLLLLLLLPLRPKSNLDLGFEFCDSALHRTTCRQVLNSTPWSFIQRIK